MSLMKLNYNKHISVAECSSVKMWLSVCLLFLLPLRFPFASCISGGSDVSPGNGQGVVLIDNFYGVHLDKIPPFCNGALVTSRLGLTVGHCCNTNPETRVFIGSTTPFSGDGQMFQMVDTRLIRHNESPLHSSLCVFKLDHDVEFNPQTLPLLFPGAIDVPGALYAFGYGAPRLKIENKSDSDHPDFLNEISPVPKYLEMPKLTPPDCAKQNYTGLRGICRGYLGSENHKRLMTHDHGAPLVELSTKKLWGIGTVHFFKDWEKEDFPTYFINIRDWMDEITEQMRELMKTD